MGSDCEASIYLVVNRDSLGGKSLPGRRITSVAGSVGARILVHDDSTLTVNESTGTLHPVPAVLPIHDASLRGSFVLSLPRLHPR